MNVAGKIGLGLTAALVLNLGVPAGWAVPAGPTGAAMPSTPVKPGKHVTVPKSVPAAMAAAGAATEDGAAPATDSNLPYGTIVARNIFGLVPIPPPPPPPPPQEDPPPKITANGIMQVFGEWQALFKVSAAGKAGQPPKDVSYMLAQGQRQDDIEVVKIDPKASTITFDNHGTQQEIPLANGAASAGGAAGAPGQVPPGAAPGGPPPMPGFHPRAGVAGGFAGAPAGAGFGVPGSPQSPQDSNASPDAALQTGGGQLSVAEIAAQNVQGLTPEQQAILIETERARLLSAQDSGQADVKKGYYPPEMIPPTPLTPATQLPSDGTPGKQ